MEHINSSSIIGLLTDDNEMCIVLAESHFFHQRLGVTSLGAIVQSPRDKPSGGVVYNISIHG